MKGRQAARELVNGHFPRDRSAAFAKAGSPSIHVAASAVLTQCPDTHSRRITGSLLFELKPVDGTALCSEHLAITLVNH